ncbi:MAG: hypothetical protein ACL93V_11595 [Candidatus Electrothrix sp. YB6]
MKHVGSLRYGVIFKKAFSHPEIFTSFVRDVETQYRPEISSIFDYIEKSCISPRDAAEMKEEAAREEKFKELEDELKAVK